MLDTNTRINDHVIWLPRGQTVAAQVPYTKRKQEWIVASVVSWNEDELTYVVKDEFPENKKMKSWTIPYHKVIRFPRDLKDTLCPGDRVLSLWYIPDTEEWSSMFYEATIVNADEVDRTSTILLRFNGDDEVYEIDSTKIVKKPKRRSKVPKRAFSAANGSLSPLPSPPSDVYDDSRHQRSASPPEQPASKKQRVKMEMEDYQPSTTRSGVETSPFSPTSSASSTSISSATSSSPYSRSTGSTPGASSVATSGASGTRERSPEREQHHQPSHSAPVSAAVFNSRYQFCGVLGKKMKRMGAILNERSKVSNT